MDLHISQADGLHLLPPVSYFDMLWLEKSSTLIITDSGGVQKEAFFFRKPCVILRNETEWKELVQNGNARLCSINREKLLSTYIEMLKTENYTWPGYYGDANASSLICQRIHDYLFSC
jgi:UDP-GlcNAc3NAcA epimerase